MRCRLISINLGLTHLIYGLGLGMAGAALHRDIQYSLYPEFYYGGFSKARHLCRHSQAFISLPSTVVFDI